MKTFLIFAAVSLAGIQSLRASGDFDDSMQSSYSEVATAGPVMISSTPFEAVAIRIDSTAPNALIAFYRSTGPVFTAVLATQTKINAGYSLDRSTDGANAVITQKFDGPPVTIPLFGVENSSYTFFQVTGPVKRTLYYRYKNPASANEGRTNGFGLQWHGQHNGPSLLP